MESGEKRRTVLHTVARTPVRATRHIQKLPGEKPADMLAQYQAMLLAESDSLLADSAAIPQSRRPFPIRESDVDPVQDNFTRALRLKLDSYINKAPGLRAVGTLSGKEARLHTSMGASPKARETMSDMRGRLATGAKGSNLPRLTRRGLSIEPGKGKISALDVLKSQMSGKSTSNYHYRTKSLLNSLGFHLQAANIPERSVLCADFEHSLIPSPSSERFSKIIDFSAPSQAPISIYHLREHIIPSRYDSKRSAAPKKRSQSNEYQSMEYLKAHKGAAMDEMYETVMCEFQLDPSLVPDDLKSVRYLGTHNIFNSHY